VSIVLGLFLLVYIFLEHGSYGHTRNNIKIEYTQKQKGEKQKTYKNA
jgi:hypothetical protein